MSLPPPSPKLTLLTLNVWGLPNISSRYQSRLSSLATQSLTTRPTPHIVALQECFAKCDFKQISGAVRTILPYAKYYHARPFGASFAILSCWPIEETSMIKCSMNGYPWAFWHGDWFVGKGLARARVRSGGGEGGEVEVLNTHSLRVTGKDHEAIEAYHSI